MPWTVNKTSKCPVSKPWGVVKKTDGKVEGCHATRAEAIRHQRALYANEPKTGSVIFIPTDSGDN